VNGRKRHLLVDTTGLVLKAVVHPADVHDRGGGKLLLGALGGRFPRLRHIWADQGYAGAFRQRTKAHSK
jgi:putative transposase